MDLKDFKFPERPEDNVSKTIPELLKEAEVRGFADHRGEYVKLFSNLFFNGGRIVPKPDIDSDYYDRVWRYLCAYMGSFSAKHESKEAICAMLLSEIVLPELSRK